uniref:Cytochrome b6-f complex subunit 6 n=1 Tax=Tmesipteris elongata TaxID=50272 RepID=A0A059UBB7_TMEEL|nr:cytochrome b6/f complex 3.5 kDa subunit [Tmesipteris elongata]
MLTLLSYFGLLLAALISTLVLFIGLNKIQLI